MTYMLTHIFLQEYWWFLISLLGALLVFLMFVQGGQTLIFTLPKGELQRSMIVNAMGRKWEFTFTTLVTFGGAFFASFPLFYATSFGGAYWVWMAILFSFIIQAVAYEFRSKKGNVFGKRTFDTFLFINGSLGPFLIGVAVGTFFTGAQFSLNEMNQVTWLNNTRGLEALLSLQNLALGASVLFLSRLLGISFLLASVDDKELMERSKKLTLFNSGLFLIAFLGFLFLLLMSEGFAVDPVSGVVSLEKYKYLHNFIQMPLILIFFLLGVVLVLLSLFLTWRLNRRAIWPGGAGTVLVVLALFLVAGYNNTAFYPSQGDLASSLTIRNASSSHFTLKTMFWVSMAIPVVVAYIWLAWNSLTSRRIDLKEIEGDDHLY